MNSPRKRPLSLAFAATLLALVTLPIIGGATAAGASTASTGTGAGAGAPAAAGTSTPTAHDVTSLAFEPTTVGDILGPESVQVTNTGSTPVTGFTIVGADPDDFIESDTCTDWRRATRHAKWTCTSRRASSGRDRRHSSP